MTTETLRVSEPRDLLATIPFLLGFEPSRSLVAVSLRGRRRRVGAVARLDLPAGGQAARDLAERLVAHLRRDHAFQTVLVVYDERGEARPEVVEVTEEVLRTSGIEVLDVWLVGDGSYRSLRCVGDCCPSEGRPLDELRSSWMAAELTWRGVAVAQSRTSAVLDLSSASTARLEAVESVAVRDRPPARGENGQPPRAAWAGGALATWRAEVERARASGAPEDASGRVGHEGRAQASEVPVEQAGRLLAALGDVAVRDGVMLACVPGSGTEPERLAVQAAASARAEALFAQVFSPAAAVAPSSTEVRAASLVLASLVRQATGGRVAPPLALLAWLAWWSGDGGAAQQYLDPALESDPSYRLAVLLRASLERGVAPGWVERARRED